MAEQTIECPKCHKQFPLTSALTAQLEDQIKEKLTKENKKLLEEKIEEYEEKLQNVKASAREEADQEIKDLKNQMKKAKEEAEKKAKKVAEESVKNEIKDLHNQLEEKTFKADKADALELKLMAKERQLKEQVASQALELAKKIETERAKIQNEVQEKYQEETRLKDAEKIQEINSLKKTVDDLNRKLAQGSQQVQGEAVEEDIENNLTTTFHTDEIIPIKKGVKGGDIHQKVNNESGKPCGSIIWECKRVKAWSDGWITKIKEDRLLVKADISIIVTEVLPKETKGFDLVEGVWVTNYQNYIGLAMALRAGLIDVAKSKLQQVGKDRNMELLFHYLTGSEFRNRVEAIMEPFVTMKEDLEKEKRSMQSAWARREKQLDKVIENTSGMYGDLQGIMGKALPEIKTLALPGVDE